METVYSAVFRVSGSGNCLSLVLLLTIVLTFQSLLCNVLIYCNSYTVSRLHSVFVSTNNFVSFFLKVT